MGRWKKRIKVSPPLIWVGGTVFICLLSGRRIAGVVREYTLNGIELLMGEGSLYLELWEVDNLHCS